LVGKGFLTHHLLSNQLNYDKQLYITQALMLCLLLAIMILLLKEMETNSKNLFLKGR